jgi:predicted GH43/DUF377 family glycosyl hydrolase
MIVKKPSKQKSMRQKPHGKKSAKNDGKKKVSKKKQPKALNLIRAEENPIISPKPENNWEAWQTFNPGVILLENKIHFLYRAIGEDGISRLGYAASDDGFYIRERLPYPVYEHLIKGRVFNIFSYFSGGSWGGAEDPRVVRVNDEDTLYMTYTACDNELGVALTSIKIADFLNKKWRWKTPKLISKPGEVHKNWVIFPEKINNQYAILHSICPEISIAYRDNLKFREGEYIESYYDGNMRRKCCWDNWLRGAGAPPIKTRAGWLLFYQAMDENDPGKYKVGVMLLDLDDPTKILYRADEPVLEPEEDYENNGFKAGVVYVTGAVVKNGELLVYYGASDSYIGVARANLEEFLKALTKKVKPKLKSRALKKK